MKRHILENPDFLLPGWGPVPIPITPDYGRSTVHSSVYSLVTFLTLLWQCSAALLNFTYFFYSINYYLLKRHSPTWKRVGKDNLLWLGVALCLPVLVKYSTKIIIVKKIENRRRVFVNLINIIMITIGGRSIERNMAEPRTVCCVASWAGVEGGANNRQKQDY